MNNWTKTVKTRKPHKCYGCGEEFPAGTTMVFSTTVDDIWASFYACEGCNKVFLKFETWDWENFEEGTIDEYR
jgi:hypothetical protein